MAIKTILKGHNFGFCHFCHFFHKHGEKLPEYQSNFLFTQNKSIPRTTEGSFHLSTQELLCNVKSFLLIILPIIIPSKSR